MPLVGAIIGEQPHYFDNFPPGILPPELLNAIKPDFRHEFHVSDLTNCPYNAVKQKLVDFFIPIENIYRMLRGKAWDALSQQYRRENTLYQHSLCGSLCGVETWGTPDIIDLSNRTIEDFKSPSRKHSDLPKQYVLQLNAYKYFWEQLHENEPIERLLINYCSPRMVDIWDVEIEPEIEEVLKWRLEDFLELYYRKHIGTCRNPVCYNCKAKAVYLL